MDLHDAIWKTIGQMAQSAVQIAAAIAAAVIVAHQVERWFSREDR